MRIAASPGMNPLASSDDSFFASSDARLELSFTDGLYRGGYHITSQSLENDMREYSEPRRPGPENFYFTYSVPRAFMRASGVGSSYKLYSMSAEWLFDGHRYLVVNNSTSPYARHMNAEEKEGFFLDSFVANDDPMFPRFEAVGPVSSSLLRDDDSALATLLVSTGKGALTGQDVMQVVVNYYDNDSDVGGSFLFAIASEDDGAPITDEIANFVLSLAKTACDTMQVSHI
jgi:hypothetical protein